MIEPAPFSVSGLPSSARIDAFITEVATAVEARRFTSLVLSKPRHKRGPESAMRVRLIALKGQPALSFVASTPGGDITTNRSIATGLAACATALDLHGAPSFAHATLHCTDRTVQLMIDRNGRATMRTHAAAAAADAAATPNGADMAGLADAAHARGPDPKHDRARARMLPLDLTCWVELGITDAAHRLVPAMARKWRQIDRFLAVIDKALGALASAEGVPLRVVDFGCGKGYLTFAVHEHLRRRFGVAPQVIGVELRAELVDAANAAAARCAAEGLRFVQGDLRSVAAGEVDLMIALHACDTATDHAIDLGLRAGAGVLVCSPCCHKELRPQMARPKALAGVLRHGIHLGQEAEMVTDSLRALLLEAAGYDASVFEFVALEHTSKNKMILATRRPDAAAQARALAEVRDVKDFYGIREQCLERLLQRQGRIPAT